jgi:hypothetical protein
LRVALRKELAELFAGRAFWLLLLFMALLTGQSFIAAVTAYAEASGIAGGAAALAQGLTPLDGIFSPTLGAYDLAIMLLFPFVAIRMIAEETSSDAVKLLLQWPLSMAGQIAAKVAALLVAWLIALIPFGAALLLWRSYGGHLGLAETTNLLAGYTLRYLLTASLAMAAAAIIRGAANAAIVVLGFTIGTWALDFLAAGRGGFIQTLASYTPAAMLRLFERGLFRIDLVLVLLLVSIFGFALAAIWLQWGISRQRRLLRSFVAAMAMFAAVLVASRVHRSYDLSENRRNSFSAADQRALSAIRMPLTVTIYLAAEDPRMNDFASNVLVKLERTVSDLRVEYPLAGRSGLFENDQHYGEIAYQLGGKRVVSRSTTEEIVLSTIEELAAVPVPTPAGSSYPGFPLARMPDGAAFLFYLVMPALVLVAWLSARGALRRRRTG